MAFVAYKSYFLRVCGEGADVGEKVCHSLS